MSIYSISPHHYSWRVVALVLSTVCFSCAAIPASDKPVPVASPVPSTLVSTVQKPGGSRITVRYRLEGRAVTNQPLTITLIFDAVTDQAATVHFTADQELQLNAGVAQVALPRGSTQLAVQVTPRSDGLFYLNVFTFQAGANSVISIPVQSGIGSSKLRKLGDSKPTVDGDPIISMPVP